MDERTNGQTPFSSLVPVRYRKGPPSQKVHWGGVRGDRVVVSVADHKAKGSEK